MYKRDKSIQYKECLICFTPLLKEPSIFQLVEKNTICNKCMKQFTHINKTISFYHHPLTILYKYDNFFRQLLYQYKGQYDYALKDTFLDLYKQRLKKYNSYIIAIAPSHHEDNIIRGFNPNESIAFTLSSQVFTGLYKTEKYKQSDLTYEQRKEVRQKISIKNKELLKGKKVLIFDDVLTSGETLKRCLELVKSCEPKKIELIVLATKQDLKELKLRVK